MSNIIDTKIARINRGEESPVTGERLTGKDAASDAKVADKLLSSLKEKALLLDHLKSKEPTNNEIETIRADLERTIKELEAINV
jgi:hypothetical protein